MIERFFRGLSMAGVFRPGDLLYFEEIPINMVRRGDIIAYGASQPKTEGIDTVHRVIAIVDQGLICRGDNNRFVDPNPVTEARLLGRAVRFERRGRMSKVLGGRAGMIRARLNWTKAAARRALTALARPLFLRLRRSGIVAFFWRPDTRRVRFCSPDGDFIKYINRGRTVAAFHAEEKVTYLRRPFDLVLWREIEAERKAAITQPRGPEA